jgi:hypothetical protein
MLPGSAAPAPSQSPSPIYMISIVHYVSGQLSTPNITTVFRHFTWISTTHYAFLVNIKYMYSMYCAVRSLYNYAGTKNCERGMQTDAVPV